MRKRLLIPLAIVIALGAYGLSYNPPLRGAQPPECDGEICKTAGGCRDVENACCVNDPCEVCVCW